MQDHSRAGELAPFSRQTRKVLNGGSAVMPVDAPKTRKRNATPGNNSKEGKLTKPKKKRRKKSAVMPGDAPNTRKVKSTPGNNSNEGKLTKPMKNGLKRRPGVVRVLVALARMIQDYLWARASRSRLLDVTTGGVWDSFVLLPRILGCWGFFTRALSSPGG